MLIDIDAGDIDEIYNPIDTPIVKFAMLFIVLSISQGLKKKLCSFLKALFRYYAL